MKRRAQSMDCSPKAHEGRRTSRPGMKHTGSYLFPWLLVLLTAASGVFAQAKETAVTAYIEGNRAAVVAFLPPAMRGSRDAGTAEAQERVGSAIEDTKLCLGEDDISYRVVFADRIVVSSPGREETFDVRYFAPLVGALLLRPGSNARILFAGGGPAA